MSLNTTNTQASFPARRPIVGDTRERRELEGLAAELAASVAREKVLLSEKNELSARQAMLAQEFEHRLVNGLQLVVSLLSMQSRAATTPEAAAQLTIAGRRVSALGRVHRRLHLLDHQDRVELKQYLQGLCDDLSSLLFDVQADYAIVVEGPAIEIPTASAIPIGFVVNELITNSMKYAKGRITVRIEKTSGTSHSLSVMDDGPGLPADFDPDKGAGLGMKIIRSLVGEIHGVFATVPGDAGRGARFVVTFPSS